MRLLLDALRALLVFLVILQMKPFEVSVCLLCPCAHSRSKQLVFTRRHENERFSSSPYSGVNLVEAPVDFERFSADNESLVDAMCACTCTSTSGVMNVKSGTHDSRVWCSVCVCVCVCVSCTVCAQDVVVWVSSACSTCRSARKCPS